MTKLLNITSLLLFLLLSSISSLFAETCPAPTSCFPGYHIVYTGGNCGYCAQDGMEEGTVSCQNACKQAYPGCAHTQMAVSQACTDYNSCIDGCYFDWRDWQ